MTTHLVIGPWSFSVDNETAGRIALAAKAAHDAGELKESERLRLIAARVENGKMPEDAGLIEAGLTKE